MLGIAEARLIRAYDAVFTHTHPGYFEIHYCAKGSQPYIIDGRRYRIASGETLITYPGESHSTGDSPQQKSIMYFLTVSCTAGDPASFLGSTVSDMLQLKRAIRSFPNRKFYTGRWLHDEFIELVRLRVTMPPFWIASFINRTALILMRLLECSAKHPQTIVSREMAAVSAYIKENIRNRILIDDLAQFAKMTVNSFNHRFKHEMGLPPKEFILGEKVAEAKRQLGESESEITDIAFSLGFTSSQLFARVFRRFTATSPGAYRRRMRNLSRPGKSIVLR